MAEDWRVLQACAHEEIKLVLYPLGPPEEGVDLLPLLCKQRPWSSLQTQGKSGTCLVGLEKGQHLSKFKAGTEGDRGDPHRPVCSPWD